MGKRWGWGVVKALGMGFQSAGDGVSKRWGQGFKALGIKGEHYLRSQSGDWERGAEKMESDLGRGT
ncbi:MAG: hypothetical protein HGGPFJEG_01713 [Ignavibacteria bacterium]|nr:hypothetical protein [Ignavibacteria bacterium]